MRLRRRSLFLLLTSLSIPAWFVNAGCSSGGGDSADCGYPDVQNDPRCPATYSTSHAGEPCPIGLSCSYPGMGDGTSPGCASTAGLLCVGDAGADTGTWGFVQ